MAPWIRYLRLHSGDWLICLDLSRLGDGDASFHVITTLDNKPLCGLLLFLGCGIRLQDTGFAFVVDLGMAISAFFTTDLGAAAVSIL